MINIKKFSLKIFLIFVAIILISCTPNPSSAKTKEIDVFVGTEGLAAEFAKTAPPPKVFEDSSFPIVLRIRNKGAYSIKENNQGVLSLGVEKDYINSLTFEQQSRLVPASNNLAYFYVDGKTQINPQGDETIISLNAKTGKLDPQSERKESTITATLCYPYQTTLSTTVCIDPDVENIRNGKKVCKVQDVSFSSGQGAPIVITQIQPQIVPVTDGIKPQFLIFVENKEKGSPINNIGYAGACYKFDYNKDSGSSKDLWNMATIKAYKAGKEDDAASQLVCTPSLTKTEGDTTGILRFRDGKDFVRCTFKDAFPKNSDAFQSSLKIVIDYGYVQSIATNFVIEKPYKR